MSSSAIRRLDGESSRSSGGLPVAGSAPGLDSYDMKRAIRNMGATYQKEAGVASEIGEVPFGEILMLWRCVSHAETRYSGLTLKIPTIFNVPKELKRGDENKCYVPVAVEIGLFMRTGGIGMFTGTDMTNLRKYKWCCVRQLISRHTRLLEPARTAAILNGCFESLERRSADIQACYDQPRRIMSSPGGETLSAAMLQDGCFILHRLLKYARLAEKEAKGSVGNDGCFILHRLLKCAGLAEKEAKGDDDDDEDDDDDWTLVVGRCAVWHLVTRDLLLLENQIPFFVLRDLFEQLRNEEDSEDTLEKGSLQLFRSLCPQMLRHEGTDPVSGIARDDVHHLLHLFYLYVGFPPGERQHDSQCSRRQAQAYVLPSELPQWIPGAKELEEAGVRFKERNNATTFLDIHFNICSGVLEIPPLQLYDYSDALFRNLIAFEQTYPDTRGDISTYAIFMDCLINTPEDMRILHLSGILVNMMNGEQDASRFFNRICSQVHFPARNYLVNLMADVCKYRNSRRNRWRAALVRDYFSNPWVAISVMAAVLLLGLTMLQTFFTVYPYYKPGK